MSENVCGDCRHWRKMPTDPMNLGAPPVGECRERLHSAMVPVKTVAGVQLTPAVYYPPVGRDHPCCSHFEASRVGVVQVAGRPDVAPDVDVTEGGTR